jgi:hypothetical protein
VSQSDLLLFLLLDDTAAALAAVVLLATYLRGPISLTPGQIDPSRTVSLPTAGQPAGKGFAVTPTTGWIDPSKTAVVIH